MGYSDLCSRLFSLRLPVIGDRGDDDRRSEWAGMSVSG